MNGNYAYDQTASNIDAYVIDTYVALRSLSHLRSRAVGCNSTDRI